MVATRCVAGYANGTAVHDLVCDPSKDSELSAGGLPVIRALNCQSRVHDLAIFIQRDYGRLGQLGIHPSTRAHRCWLCWNTHTVSMNELLIVDAEPRLTIDADHFLRDVHAFVMGQIAD